MSSNLAVADTELRVQRVPLAVFEAEMATLPATARSVLTVLRVRGIVVAETARERILAEKEMARLERWLEKSATASSIDEVLDDPG